MLAVAAFGLGCLFDRGLEASVVAAWFFTWFCVDLSAMIVIISLWLLLSKLEMS